MAQSCLHKVSEGGRVGAGALINDLLHLSAAKCVQDVAFQIAIDSDGEEWVD